MDLFEKLYKTILKHKLFEERSTPGLLQLQDLTKYLDVFSSSFGNESNQMQCVASREFVGIHGSQIFLPEKIDYFDDALLNKKLYQNLILQIVGAHELKLFGQDREEAPIVQRLHFLVRNYSVNLYLDSILPHYHEFQSDLLGRCHERSKSQRGYQKQVFNYWYDHALTRVPMKTSIDTLIASARSRDVTPEFMYLTVPCLERFKIESQAVENSVTDSVQGKAPVETEIEKTYSGMNQEIDLQNEKSNPIMHSFEKLETADEYSGGRTMDSGDDDLGEHSKALDELNLTKLTRGGESAKSVFNSEISIEFEFSKASGNNNLNTGHTYPEWNYKKNRYLKDHCFLVQNPIDIALGSNDFKDSLLAKNKFQIKHWQSRIQSLFNEPLWQKKLSEGDEIDLDEVIRDFGAMKNRQTISARWYMSRKKQITDVEVVLLFDQSHSSDSWIQNRRVLDISLEAVGTAGLLFDQVFEAVTVAGIWSSTRHNCSFQIYKNALEPWSAFYKKMNSIQPQGYTRLGPAIRHATSLLKSSLHRKKLILLLTDGKPTDVDGYEGPIGIRDVNQACREAEVNGILHYALILDHKQKAHYSRMFKHYALLHDPKMVSEELFNILLRLIKT